MAIERTKDFGLNLANEGDYYDFPMDGLDTASFEALDGEDWGSAVVELMPVIGGRAKSFGSALELKVTGSLYRHSNIDRDSVDAIRAVVTTADTSKTYGRLRAIGQGKD